MSLARTRQTDFSAGAFRSSAPHLISSRGTFDVENGLHDDDGAIFRRGGAQVKADAGAASNSDYGRFVWDGVVGPNLERTVYGGQDGIGVLLADDSTHRNVGGAVIDAPCKPALIDSMLFIPDDSVNGWLYGGSRRGASGYSTGTVSITNGSKVVTGAGGANFTTAAIEPGDLFYVATAARLRVYVVETVDSSTQLTLLQAVEEATAAGLAYELAAVAHAQLHGVASGASAGAGPCSSLYCAHANRLLWLEGKNTIRFSPGLDPETGAYRAHERQDTDFHTVQEGVEVVAIESLRDRALVFTTAGVYAITNMAFDLVDAAGNVQQRMERISDDVVAWGPAAICPYKGALIVPALDNIYVVDGLGAPVPVADTWSTYLRSITADVSAPGGAVVHEGHLLLPVVLPGSATVQETWVVRLDRPVQTGRGLAFAWSRFTGAGGQHWSYARRTRASEAVLLLGGSNYEPAYITDCTAFFRPEATDEIDFAVVGGPIDYTWAVETREWLVAAGAPGMVRTVRILYEMQARFAAPEIALYVKADENESAAWTLVAGAAAPAQSSGDVSMEWWAFDVGRECRAIRFRFVCSDESFRLALREIDFWTRLPGNEQRG